MTEHVPGWQLVQGRLETSLKAKNFAAAMAFLNQLAELAEEQSHHPDIDLRYNRIRLRVLSHDVGQLTERDTQFATAANLLIDDAGLKTEPERITRAQITIDAMEIAALTPFWAAVTGFKSAADDLLVDPADVLPPIWFQPMDEPRPERSTTHLDVIVAADQAQARVQAALDAGGTLRTDEHAPDFWVLADAEGNEACVCT